MLLQPSGAFRDLFGWAGKVLGSLDEAFTTASHSLAPKSILEADNVFLPFPTNLGAALATAGIYLFSVLTLSCLMMCVKPKEVHRFKFFYNAFQMIVCSYMAAEAAFCVGESGYVFMACNNHIPVTPRIAHLYWIFYLSKFLDFFDTALIVLGKKWAQLSFLHLLHHSGSLVMTALMLKVPNNVELISTVGVNTFVHFLTYTYFFVASHLDHGGAVWWKKYVLNIELLQFLLLLMHLFVFPWSCHLKGVKLCRATEAGRVAAISWYSAQLILFSHLWKKSKKKTASKVAATGSVANMPPATTKKNN